MNLQSILLWGLAIFLTALLYHDTAAGLFIAWLSSGEDSHGLVVLGLAAWTLFDRRSEIKGLTIHRWAPGVLFLIFAMVLFLLGRISVEYYTQRVSMVVFLAGAVCFLYGKQALKTLALPLVLLLISIPLPAIIANSLTLPLKHLVTAISAQWLRVIGIPVFKSGNILELVGIRLEVVNACSGIRSIFALGILALLFSFTLSGWVRKTILVLSVIPVAIFSNAIRITITGVLVTVRDPESALKFYHAFSGWLIFIFSFLLIFLFHHLLSPGKRAKPSLSKEKKEDSR